MTTLARRAGVLLALWIGTAGMLLAQQDRKAGNLLNQVAEAYRAAGAVKVTFTGTQSGTLVLKGDKFYLHAGGVESWYDGRTQWSYVKQNEEVNVSTPTAEELQGINPYRLISDYRRQFNYTYAGTTVRNGLRGQEVVLTPKWGGDISRIVLHVDGSYHPDYLLLTRANGQRQEIIVRSWATNRTFTDDYFRFDARKHPGAEVIDMR